MGDASSEGGAPVSLGASSVQQLRQLSLPLFVRIAAFLVALAVMAVAAFFFAKGAGAPPADTDWFDLGAKIVSAAFLPFLVVGYVAFAETGEDALLGRTRQLLTERIPTAIRSATGSEDDFDAAGFSRCEVTWSHSDKSASARYRVVVHKGAEAALLRCAVTINVGKAVAVVFVPCLDRQQEAVLDMLRETLAGARHEKYELDEHKPVVEVAGRRYLRVVARKVLAQDFLWDPGQRLHFAQDLSAFLLSYLSEGWVLFRDDASKR